MSKTKFLSRLAILLGLVLGTVIALIAGETSFDGVGDADIVAFPTPFAFGSPLFQVGAIVSMTIVVLVIMVETTADILAVGEVVGTSVDSRRIADGLRADMISSAIAPVFNSFPATAFAQNVGLVALTGIKSRFVVATGGAVLAVLGLSPILAAVVGVLPLAVLAGAGIVLFGTVTASGIRTLGRVEYANNNNLIIVAVSIGFGVIPIAKPEFWGAFPTWFQTIFDSEISAAAIVAFLLNLFFNVLAARAPRRSRPGSRPRRPSRSAPTRPRCSVAAGRSTRVNHARRTVTRCGSTPSGLNASWWTAASCRPRSRSTAAWCPGSSRSTTSPTV